MTSPEKPLKNEKRETFCVEYIKDFNATQAALRTGYSKHTAMSQGSRLLSYAEVSERIQWLRSQKWKALHMDADEVIAQVARMARFDPRKLVDEKGNPKAIQDLDDDTALALTAVDFETTKYRGKVATKLNKYRTDKAKAQEMILRVHGRFEKDNKQKGDAIGDALGNAIARARDSGGAGALMKPRKPK